MTIEQKINKIIEKCRGEIIISMWGIECWTWDVHDKKEDVPLIISKETSSEELDMRKKIINIIKEGENVECLTSNSEYIRECKRFFIQNPNWKVEKLIDDYRAKN